MITITRRKYRLLLACATLGLLLLVPLLMYAGILPVSLYTLRDTGSRDFVVKTQKDQDLMVRILIAHGMTVMGMDDDQGHRGVFFMDGTGIVWLKKPPAPGLNTGAVLTLVNGKTKPGPDAEAIVAQLKTEGHTDAKVINDPASGMPKGKLALIVCPSLSPDFTLGTRSHFLELPELKTYTPGK